MAKKDVLKQLKSDLISNQRRITTVFKYYVKLPLSTVHKDHAIGSSVTISHTVDKRVIGKIYELVSKNVTQPNEVRRCLEEYVEKDILGNLPTEDRPKTTCRKYYPTKQDLRNHIARAIAAQKYCKDDQESLRHKVELWKANGDCKIFYRPTGKDDANGCALVTAQKFLFVHQQEWQERLLKRYGSELVLMDATYKTTKYALPLFFICVHTNVGYKVVAEFICQNEDSESIAEALAILKSWNPWWSPLYFMIDFSTTEINAIEKQFAGVAVYICDFHRIQAWQRWVRSTKNGLTPKEQQVFLSRFQHVARATDAKQYENAVQQLRSSPVYHKSNVQSYVENTWMTCEQRWAQVFRKQQAVNIVNTNNGVESQNKHFKYDYLPRAIDKSVYGVTVMLIESFLPDSYQHYIDTNFKQSSVYRRYNDGIPSYLRDRPRHFIKHCTKSSFAAGEFRDTDVECIDNSKRQFCVRSATDKKKKYEVDFSVPRCSCESWRKTQFPCKHFYAIFNTFEEWNFTSLPQDYTNSVFITLDKCIGANDFPKKRKIEELKNFDSSFGANDDLQSHVNEQELRLPNQFENNISKKKEAIRQMESSRLQKSLIEKLNLARDCAFQVEDPEHLREALVYADKIYEHLIRNCPTSEGLPVRASPKKKRLKVTRVEYHQVFHKKLPLRRKKKDHTKNCKDAGIRLPKERDIKIPCIIEKSPIKVRTRLEQISIIQMYYSLCLTNAIFSSIEIQGRTLSIVA